MKTYMNSSGKYTIMQNGDIFSEPKALNGILKGKGFTKRKLLKKQILSTGYESVNLGANERNVLVHRLVAKLYLDIIEDKLYVNHINGRKDDNRVQNLEWVSSSENMEHSHEVLRQKLSNKLSIKEMGIIIRRFNEGETMVSIKKDFQVSYNTIRRVISGAEYDTKTSNCNYSKNNKARKSGSERITKIQEEQIIKLKKDGKTYEEISKEVNVSKYTVAVRCGWKR